MEKVINQIIALIIDLESRKLELIKSQTNEILLDMIDKELILLKLEFEKLLEQYPEYRNVA